MKASWCVCCGMVASEHTCCSFGDWHFDQHAIADLHSCLLTVPRHSTGVCVCRWDAHFDGHMDIHGFDPKDFADWIRMEDDRGSDGDDGDSNSEEKEEGKEDYNNNWLRSFRP